MSPRPAPPSAPFDSVRAVKAAMQAAALTPASLPGQVATLLQILLAAGLASAWLDDSTLVVLTVVGLGASVVVGLATPIGLYFRRVSGVIIALCGMGLTLVVHALTDARLFGSQAPWVFLAVALVPIGLDWRFVPRLRARTVCSGLVVFPLIGADESWAFGGAVLWFTGALVTLWVLERDVERAAMRPVRITGTGDDDGARLRTIDVLRPIGLGLAIGLAVALLVGDVGCSRPDVPTPSLSAGSFGSQSLTPPSSLLGSDSGASLSTVDPSGHEYEYQVDEQGRRWVEGTDGTRWYVDEQDGRTVVRDGNGDVRGEIDGNSVTVYDGSGSSQTYTRRDDGGYAIEGPDGQQYRLDFDGTAWVLRDESGGQILRSDPAASQDHLYVRDPQGNLLIPDADGDGSIPLPPTDGRGPLSASPPGQTTTVDGDRVTVRDPDGTTRTYDRDDQGRDRVRVDGPYGAQSFVYEDTDDGLRVTEYDENGNVVGQYLYDPQGQLTPAAPGAAGGSPGATSRRPDPSEPSDDDGLPWRWIVAGLLLVAAAVTATMLLARRRRETAGETDWAHRLTARLDDEGRRRGQPRARGETLVDYTARLFVGPLPDARLLDIGHVLSAAMFSPEHPSDETRSWVERTVDEITTSYPVPRRGAKAHV